MADLTSGTKPELPATYGGMGWQTRQSSLAVEVAEGRPWHRCGFSSEWGELREVILHWPGEELNFTGPPDRMLMLARPDLATIRRQAEGLAAIYEQAGVTVHFTRLAEAVPANFLFQRDLFWATPQGVVLARPAAAQRAGEERPMARVLAGLGVPILYHPHSTATFEGADALWLDLGTVLIGRGLRTNRAAIGQLRPWLAGLGVEVLEVALPGGCQHLLGVVNLVAGDLAVVHGGRVTPELRQILDRRGFRRIELPPDAELNEGLAMNFVTLAPRRILMPAGCPAIRARFRAEGIEVLEAEISEYRKAAGGIGCLTGILRRG